MHDFILVESNFVNSRFLVSLLLNVNSTVSNFSYVLHSCWIKIKGSNSVLICVAFCQIKIRSFKLCITKLKFIWTQFFYFVLGKCKLQGLYFSYRLNNAVHQVKTILTSNLSFILFLKVLYLCPLFVICACDER
jgi:hypothetical protein